MFKSKRAIVLSGILSLLLLILAPLQLSTLFTISLLKMDTLQGVPTIYVPDVYGESTAKEWEQIGDYLVNTDSQTIQIVWRGYGGAVILGERLIDKIKRARAQGKVIIFKLTGDSYSMHAFTVCYASKVVNSDNHFLMFHQAAYVNEKGATVRAKDQRLLEHFINQCERANVLSREAAEKLRQGSEVYVDNTGTSYQPDTRPLEAISAPQGVTYE